MTTVKYCGYDGEIQIKEDESGKLIWECPNCGNRDQDKMSCSQTEPVDISEHSSGIREELRRSRTECLHL